MIAVKKGRARIIDDEWYEGIGIFSYFRGELKNYKAKILG